MEVLRPSSDSRIFYVGHGGMESSSSILSPLHVISHELGHVQELRRSAMERGESVSGMQVKINYEFRNGRLVATSGETTANFRKEDRVTLSEMAKKTLESLNEKSKTDEDSDSQTNEIDKNSLQTPDQEDKLIQSLEDRLRVLKQEVDEKKKFGEIDPLKEEEKRQVETELRVQKLKQELEKSFDLLKKANEAHSKNPFKLIQANYEIGSNFDTVA